MAYLSFWKLQSIGNDFPLIHLADVVVASDTPEAATQTLANLTIAMCDRRLGVGGDGLLAIGMEGDALRVRMFNPDGTEDFCGNGIRCAARHASDLGWVLSKFTVRHLNREVPVEVEGNVIRTTLGAADYHPERVPTKAYGELFNTTIWSGIDGGTPLSLFGSTLTTGTTHTVIPTTSLPDDDSFRSVSARIEVDPMFPERTSVIWTQELEPNHLRIRIWERGVGETMGCGTGASAAAADYLRRKQSRGKVTVDSPGGTLQIEAAAWHEPLTLIGQAQAVYSGNWPLA